MGRNPSLQGPAGPCNLNVRGRKARMRREYRQRLGTVILYILLIAPILIYTHEFGWAITANHTRWSEMGSAMSGIYSPIFSFLALLVLIAQTKSQNQINEHQYDQSFILEARGDIHYYLDQLDRALEVEIKPNVTFSDILRASFIPAAGQALESEDRKTLARELNRAHPRPFATWQAIYTVLAGLKAVKRYPYEHNFSAAKQKVIMLASYENCVALDNYSWVVTEGRFPMDYEFSTDIQVPAKEQ